MSFILICCFIEKRDFKNNQTGGVRVDTFLQLFGGVNMGFKIRRGPSLSDRAE